MLTNLESAAAQMHALAKSDIVTHLQGANEAETRLLLIDRVLNILGWSIEEYKPEQITSTGGYTDYRLTINGKAQLIVEAKRFGLVGAISKSLALPQYKNTYLRNSCGEDMSALLDQCRFYCQDCGVDYAVATTDDIWIVLIGASVGVEWGKLHAFVFHSLDDIAHRFNLFYDLISREAVKRGSLNQHFSSIRLIKPQAAIRPRSMIEHVAEIAPVPHRRAVRAFFESFMDDITRADRADMLVHCYVDNPEITEFSRDLRVLLEYDVVLDEQEDAIETVNNHDLQREIEDQWASSDPKTILLVGRIGAGKSTFVHKFIREQAIPKKHICVLINLIDQAIASVKQTRDEEQHISRLILDNLFEKFRDRFDPHDPSVLRACFRTEVEQFRSRHPELYQRRREEYLLAEESYLNEQARDTYRHLVGYAKFVRNKNYKIWVTLDNIDQGSYSYQEFVYTFAHRLAHDARCVVLITLREDTFLEAQDAGFLNVRRSDIVFRLNAPELLQVIAKRRRYVDYVLSYNKLPRSLSKNRQLVQLLNLHLKELFLGSNDTMRKFITALSLGNVRYSLQLIQDYYTSPHAPVHNLYDPAREQLDEDIDLTGSDVDMVNELERFIQALMLKHDWSYDERDSDIYNLFAVDADEQRSHFIALVILAYLTRESVSPKSSVKLEKLCADLTAFGYQKHQVIEVVKRMLLGSLLVSPKMPIGMFKRQDIPDLSGDTRVSISAKGYYYLNHLSGHTYYQARVAEDTIWYNEDLATYYTIALQESYAAQTAQEPRDALMKTDAHGFFLEYLNQAWIQEYQSARARVQSEWARIVHMIEECVFRKRLTQAVSIPDVESAAPVMASTSSKRGSTSISSTVIKAVQEAQPTQLTIFPTSSVNYEKAFHDAVNSLGPMPNSTKVHRSTCLLRVLWAMEIAFRCGLTGLRASDLARIINQYGNGNVAAPNVAKFFRIQRKTGEFGHLWSETVDGCITINHAGRELLLDYLEQLSH